MLESFDRRTVVKWVNAMFVMFTLLGFSIGTWLSRLPAIRDQLDVSTGGMSVFILAMSTGSIVGLALSGRTVSWLGPRRTLFICVFIFAAAMPAVAALFWMDARVAAAAVLVIFGFTFSTSDVAVNVSGATAERALGRPRMTLLHAGFSLGTVIAMLLGTFFEATSLPVPAHFVGAFTVVMGVAPVALFMVPRDEYTALDERETAEETGQYRPWRDPLVYAFGFIALSMALSEGVASDWLPLSLVDGRGVTNAFGTLVLGVFLGSMTLARVAGSWLLDRLGRVLLLRASSVLLLVGLAIVILVPATWAFIVGAVLWGAGSAFGFPVAISAAADNPAVAVKRVAAVSAIAYGAFIIGPAGVGGLGEMFGLLPTFWLLAVFALLVIVLAQMTRGPRVDR